ncbi:MAG: alkaline phosphatase [Deltaproteobacteria bacterium]|nr:alkaline phosphatase [Deltaproteobacteria bacterium]
MRYFFVLFFALFELSAVAAVKNVIFMIGDGMGYNQIHISQELLGKKLFLTTLPVSGMVFTSSANNRVTDSAAAATALATAHKTNNQSLGKDPQGQDLPSLLEKLKKTGKRTGLVTTTSLTDATPAAFATHVSNRKEHPLIAQWLLKNKVDLLLGGGRKYFLPLLSQFKKEHYELITSTQELSHILPLKNKRLLGLFHEEHLNYEIDREEIPEMAEEPSLSQMTQAALQFLKNSPKGFFLMVEGGKIDHAGHEIDLATMAREVLEFDHAIEKAVAFAKKRKDTLIIVTADHETAALGFVEATDIPHLQSLQVSAQYMIQKFQKDSEGKFTEESIKTVLKDHAHFPDVTQEELQILQKISNRSVHDASVVLGSLISKRAEVVSVSLKMIQTGNTHGHSSAPVPVFSFGPGAQSFTGTMDNTAIPLKISKLTHVSLH